MFLCLAMQLRRLTPSLPFEPDSLTIPPKKGVVRAEE